MPPAVPPIEIDSEELPSSHEQDKIPAPIYLVMDFKNLSIRELLDQCLRTNDQVGWEEFVERITPTILGVAYNTYNNLNRGRCDPDVIQDFVQTTLVKLFNKDKKALREFIPEHENSFYGYVKTITRNAVFDELRKPPREDPLEEALELAGSRASDRALVSRVQRREVEKRLEKLAADQMEKDIFWFYFIDGYTAKEISEMPDISLSAKRVETILSRLVRQLRREIGGATAIG